MATTYGGAKKYGEQNRPLLKTKQRRRRRRLLRCRSH
jgi:hypothetical protein